MKANLFIFSSLKFVLLFTMCFNYCVSQETSKSESNAAGISETESKIDLEDLNKFPPLNIGILTAEYNSQKYEQPFEGTFYIKDGYLNLQTKEIFTQFKILSYDNGVMTCSDKDMVHTYKLVEESGKIKGFKYDAKLEFIPDKKMQQVNSIMYWCKKKK